MEVFGHIIALYGALRRSGLSHEKAMERIEENAAKLCLTDAIRVAVKEEINIVCAGRGYSHFTDGCAMKLPVGEDLKAFSNAALQTTMVTGEGYRNKFADKPTDFGVFFTMNPHLFTAENMDWGLAVLAHLQQDVNTDVFWQERICKVCDTENNRVVYRASGREVDGDTFRKDMATVNKFMHAVFVMYVKTNMKSPITEAEFISKVGASLERFYPEYMAENTKKYLVLDKAIFSGEEEAAEELCAQAMATGMFKSEKRLMVMTVKLFEDAMTSLNILVNHFVRM